MKIKLITIVICLFVLCSYAYSKEEIVFINQQITIDFPGIKKASIGNPAIATAKVIKELNQILITGESIGRTNLTVWDKYGQKEQVDITVMMDLSEMAKEIRERLYGVKGIYVRTARSRVIISGTIKNKSDVSKVAKIINDYPLVVNDTTVSDTMIHSIVVKMNNEFKKFKLDNISAERIGKTIIIVGEVPDKEAQLKAKIIASSLFGNVKYAFQLARISKKTISIKVDFIEIDKDIIDELGIKWSDSNGKVGVFGVNASAQAVGGFGLNHTPLSGNYSINGNYNIILNTLKTSGKSRILAQPRLVCASGKTAEFITGGEIPIQKISTSSTITTQSNEYKPFGIHLIIKPVVNDINEISSQIKLEHSDIANYLQGAPVFHKSSVDTSIKVKSGQTIVLSGLFSLSNKKSIDQLSFIGSIPILGYLFKSKSVQNGKSEIIIFVTPEIVHHDLQQVQQLPNEMMKKFKVHNHEFSIAY